MHQRAYVLCQDIINARGGILDRSIVFDIRDDRGEAKVARNIYDTFIAEMGADLVLAPYSSDLTAAVAPIAEEHGFPILAAGAAANSLWRRNYRNLIGVLTPASRYTQGVMRLAAGAGLGKIALLHAPDEFSREIAAGTRKWAPFLKLKMMADIELPPEADGDKAIMQAVRESGAELIIIAGYLNEAVRMRRALGALGWYPQAFFATVGPSFPNWKSVLGPDAERAFTTSVWEPNGRDGNTDSLQFTNAFKDRYGVMPSYHAAAAFAACQVLEAALVQAGSTDHDKYRDALFRLDINTVIGRFAVDRTGMQTKRLDMVVQWIEGEKQIVWPAEARTRDAIFGPRSP